MPSPNPALPARLRLLIWCNALAVCIILLTELLVLDFAFAWFARGYLGGAWTFKGVLIAGAVASLLICGKILVMALRAERAVRTDPSAVEIGV